MPARRTSARCALAAALAALWLLGGPRAALASTYAVYIPLDSSIYAELDTLNGLGFLDSYLPEIKPITRVEAARLALEAEANLDTGGPNHLADSIVKVLRAQLKEEINWLEEDHEDGLPTMVHPVERVEGQYIYSGGVRRKLDTGNSGIDFTEGTPLLPNNDNLSTGAGSNETLRWSGWMGLGGFIAGYGEGAISGPLTHGPRGLNRAQLLTGEAVVGLGNVAISFGQEEMAWGTGQFGSLSQSNNGLPFPALRIQNIHPSHLPGILRYLGLFRWQAFFGELDGGRQFAHPWIDGQILSFKPLPNIEYGFTHTIMFGGRGNDHYGFGGFLGRATGFATGSPAGANTNSRGGLYVKYRMPGLRNTVLYQEILGEDNLSGEISGIGRFMPFLAVSYQGGVYIPELTSDGRTTAQIEYAILDPNYSTHSDSLYWTYQNSLMGYELGPNGSKVDIDFGRWSKDFAKVDLDLFYTERAPMLKGANLSKEHSGGLAIDYWQLPVAMSGLQDSLGEVRTRIALEYVNNINYSSRNSIRSLVQISVGLNPSWRSLVWR
ncbi:MAG TPA: capsule assembly Wzi family protein [Candidatus Binataceae bacterium]|nr:capsule assembly Wzi family protein [Candidatus Binataceae bacterium]